MASVFNDPQEYLYDEESKKFNNIEEMLLTSIPETEKKATDAVINAVETVADKLKNNKDEKFFKKNFEEAKKHIKTFINEKEEFLNKEFSEEYIFDRLSDDEIIQYGKYDAMSAMDYYSKRNINGIIDEKNLESTDTYKRYLKKLLKYKKKWLNSYSKSNKDMEDFVKNKCNDINVKERAEKYLKLYN